MMESVLKCYTKTVRNQLFRIHLPWDIASFDGSYLRRMDVFNSNPEA